MNDFTVGELRRALASYNDEDTLRLPGDLTFYRVRAWGDNGALIEVGEPIANLSPKFRKNNPHVQCAFIALGALEDHETD